MSVSKDLLKGFVLVSAASVLAACGGGGGGGGGGGNAGIAASPPLTVTSANAGTVAGETFQASDGLTGSSSGAFGVLPATLGHAPSAHIGVVDTLIQQVKRAPTVLDSGTSGVAAAAVQSINEPCDSGSISGSFNDADGDLSLSTGDTVSLTASNCNLGGVIMNGTVSVSNVVVSGDEFTFPYNLQFTLQASSFSITSGTESVVMSGDGTISEASSDGVTFTSSFGGSGIRITSNGNTLTLTDYAIVETTDVNTAYSITINATISSTTLGGSVRVTTNVPLTGTGTLDPDAGQITCVGANNTRVTLVAVDSLNVQLEVDVDGNGVTDEIISAAWADL
jgi:hypothetical protein